MFYSCPVLSLLLTFSFVRLLQQISPIPIPTSTIHGIMKTFVGYVFQYQLLCRGSLFTMHRENKNIDIFSQHFKVKVYRLTDMEIEFDLIGIDASIANAFRRILIAEVL
jgi:hypothetical protein